MPTTLCGPLLLCRISANQWEPLYKPALLFTVMKQKMAFIFRDVSLEAFRNTNLYLEIKDSWDDFSEIIHFLRTQETECHSQPPAPPESFVANTSVWFVHLCPNSSLTSTVTITTLGKSTPLRGPPSPLDYHNLLADPVWDFTPSIPHDTFRASLRNVTPLLEILQWFPTASGWGRYSLA